MDDIYRKYEEIFRIFFLIDNRRLNTETEGRILKIIRFIYGPNQTDLSREISVSSTFISAMENGKKRISRDTKAAIAKMILRRANKSCSSNNKAMYKLAANEIVEAIQYHKSFFEISQEMNDIADNLVFYTEAYEKINNLIGDIDTHESFLYHNDKINKNYNIQSIFSILNKPSDAKKHKKETLINNLIMVLEENEKHQDELLNVLHKSLADISSFFNDIDIIRKYDLETTIDRISRSIKKLLRESYNDIHKDVPILGYVGAGIPYEYVSLNDIINIPKTEKVDFALNVRGDSMSPAYQDGDVVFVKRQSDLENGEYGIFEIEGQYLFKRYFKENGNIKLTSLNKSYDDIVFTKEDKPQSFTIIGKVIIGSK